MFLHRSDNFLIYIRQVGESWGEVLSLKKKWFTWTREGRTHFCQVIGCLCYGLEKVKKQTVFFTLALNLEQFYMDKDIVDVLVGEVEEDHEADEAKVEVSNYVFILIFIFFFPILKWYIFNKITLIFIILFVFIFILYLYKNSRLYCLLQLI